MTFESSDCTHKTKGSRSVTVIFLFFFWPELASFGQLGRISDPHIDFQNNWNGIYQLKELENMLHYIEVRWDVSRTSNSTNTSCSEDKYILNELFLRAANTLTILKTTKYQFSWSRLASFGQLGLISDPNIVLKFPEWAHSVSDHKRPENIKYTVYSGVQGDVLRPPHDTYTSCSEDK